jgi:hypothetical protein
MNLPEWTDEELLPQRKNVLKSLVLAPISYLKQQGQSIADYGKYGGEFYAPGWEGMKGKGALEIARIDAFNWVVLGATLISLEGDEKQASFVVDWSIKEMVGDFGISLEEVTLMMDVLMEQIAAFLSIKYTSQRDGERWTREFSY